MSLLYSNLGAGAAIILLLALRRTIKKYFLPKVMVMLWLLIMLRLVLPFEFASDLSIYNFEYGNFAKEAPAVSESFNISEHENFEEVQYEERFETTELSVQKKPKQYIQREDVLLSVWVSGAVITAALIFGGYFNTVKKCKENAAVSQNTAVLSWLKNQKPQRKITVMENPDIYSPVSFGIFNPNIVFPTDPKEEDIPYFMAHEYVHIRDKDILLKFLGAAAIIINWFDPLVWAAAAFMNRDIEIYCDYRTLAVIGEKSAPAYMKTLLSYAQRKSVYSCCVNNLSVSSLEERMVAIVEKDKKKSKRVLSAGLILCTTLAVAVFGSTPIEKVESEPKELQKKEPQITFYNDEIAKMEAEKRKIEEKYQEISFGNKTEEKARPYKKTDNGYERTWNFYEVVDESYALPLENGCEELVHEFSQSPEFDSVYTMSYIEGEKGEEVLSMKSGKVLFSGFMATGYGRTVLVMHDDGTSAVYGHCSELCVESGDIVEQGAVIAKVGSSGNTVCNALGLDIFDSEGRSIILKDSYGERQTWDYFLKKLSEQEQENIKALLNED